MKYRKYIAFLLALAMLFTLTACGGGDKKENTGGPSNTGNSAADEDYSWWEGDWYGWWMIFDGDGYYADYINEAWDCCVYIEPRDNGHLISIWDEDANDYENNCLAEVEVEIDLGKNVAKSIGTVGDYFWGVDVGAGDWVIDPEDTGVDNMLMIESSFTDENGDYCEYGVVLTKWGYEWNEADATYPPDYYESFFLPLMESGGELPVVFDPK